MALRILAFIIALTCSGGFAYAEYRVFELVIADQTTGSSRRVIGTLDDIQYGGYFPVSQSEQITIADTWVCEKNRTQNYRPYCPSPRAPASAVVK